MTAHGSGPAAGGEAAAPGLRDVLRLADFRRVWAAQAISDIGDGMTGLALMLVVTLLTHSTAALALCAIALAVPTIVIGPVAGVFVDRWDRRTVMLASDVLRAAIVLGFVLVRSADSVWILYLLAFAHSSVGTFFTPARMALVPRIVPPEALLAANSLSQGTRVIASVLGSMAAGIFVGTFGTAWPAFTLDALTFLLSFGLVLGVMAPSLPDPSADASADRAASPRARALADLREGLAVVRGSPTLIGVLVGAGVTMLGLGAVNVLFVPLVLRDLGQPATWLGAVDGAQTISMVLAAGLVGALASRARPGSIVVLGLVGVAIFCGLLAGVSAIWQIVVLLFAVGWFVTPLSASIVTIVQSAVDDRRRGRVAALLHSVMSLASVLSMAFAGIFGDLLGVRVVFLIAAIIVGLAAAGAALLFRLPDRPIVTVGEPAIEGASADG